ncbi:pimeloyl-[acyl-carrier protein] methyl ester esterase [Anaerobacterium chartisolvens]|uniref:Pimeloyl-[acyl-carrier protein] methyl ester esterase n=1 Tax=Anaerobacterium chartisolvens TaxID=1297424 RepID=A0A369BCS1_9FIRM|nr:alpha/beta fold hydrolase [Anaerobacterium chartisolvens]RCX18376.1 pimeloyl-[acyl-carrier protein] methyl ester esterase [Anaerobacterium chartisolvens]
MKNYILILSGWAVNKVVWQPLCELMNIDYEIDVFDWNDINSTEEYAQKVISHIEAKKIGRVTLLGWSLGSLTAMEIAEAYPSRVERMVLFNGTARFVCDNKTNYKFGWDKRNIDKMLFVLTKQLENTLNSFYKKLFTYSEKSKGYYNNFLETAGTLTNTYSVKSLSVGLEYLISKDMRTTMERINTPVCLIHGEGDRICPLEAGIYLDRHLNKSRLTVLAATGHMPFYTQPEKCVQIINDFLLKGLL